MHYKLESSPVDIYHCLAVCDNDNLCESVMFDDANTECKLFEGVNTALSSEDNMICFEKEYISPQNRFFKFSETPTDKCVGELLFGGYGITDNMMDAPTVSECRSLCNTMYDCSSFTYRLNATNSLQSDCTFYTGYITTVDNDVGFTSVCYSKDTNILNAFIGHEEMSCGTDVHTTLSNVEHSYHSCYVNCNADQLCNGFEFNNDTDSCSLFRNVTLGLEDYKTCYSKSYGTEQIGKHSVRLRFLDATYSAGVHGLQAFEDYMILLLQDILHETVIITAIVSGSVVIDYLVTSELNSGLGFQDTVTIMDTIINDGTYDLGTQLVGGSNPPPPTFSPTSSPSKSPSQSPTSSPSVSPTLSPTGSPTTGTPSLSPTSLSPTSAPTTSAPTTRAPTLAPSSVPILHNPDTVKIIEYVGYTLLGIDGVLVIYFMYQAFFKQYGMSGDNILTYRQVDF